MPGIEAPRSTVMVGCDRLAIDLHSHLPDGSVTDFKEALQTSGGLAREHAGVIRMWETYQIHLLYSWVTLLHQREDLEPRWQRPEYVPATTLGQLMRWSAVALSQLFRGSVDLGRPADVCLYHVGCFELVLPSGCSLPLTGLVLYSLKQERPQHSMDEVLETFRQAGAMLRLHVPKCKQNQFKRQHNGNQSISWLSIRRSMLLPELGVVCPTRALCWCLAVSWWARGTVSARVLTLRKAGSCGRAAPKRHAQQDFQGQATAGGWKAPTSHDIHGFSPALFLLQRQQQQQQPAEGPRRRPDDGSESAAGASSSSSSSQPAFWLGHVKLRKGSAAAVLLKLRQLSGSDLRDSQQKCALQSGVPLDVSARLAAHTQDEAKRYSANCRYELCDVRAAVLKLASPEWCARDPLPAPVGAGDSLFGVPYDVELFSTQQPAVAAAAPPAAGSALAAVLGSMQDSIRQVEGFVASYAGLPGLNDLLHGPVLGRQGSAEVLPVKPLRQFQGVLHLRSASIGEFCGRLPRLSAAGLAAPAAERLVRPELAGVSLRLAEELGQLCARLAGRQEAGAGAGAGRSGPQLRLQHYAQATFGRLDVAWQQAVAHQQQRAEEVVGEQQAMFEACCPIRV